MKPFPWQIENWNKLQLANQAGRMTHAVLFTGPVGIGLKHFSNCLTASLLCENSDADTHACGDCRSCHLIKGESHPDLFNIEPEESGKQIRVDEVRKLIDSIHLKSTYGRCKIAVIAPADAMNRSAANSLLKTLEEPPGHSLLILLSHRPNLLPITIRSRCQHVRFNPAYDDATVRWVNENLQAGENAEDLLKMAGGAPLAIEEMLESHVLEYQRNILDDLFALKGRRSDDKAPASCFSILLLVAPLSSSLNCTPIPAVLLPWEPFGVIQTIRPATGNFSLLSIRLNNMNTSSPRL